MKRYSIFILLFVWFVGVFLYFKGFAGLVSVYEAIKVSANVLVGKTFFANRYENTPCEGKSFAIKKDMILLENKNSSFVESFYEISRYSLEDYKTYLKNEGIDFYLDDKSEYVLNSKNPFHKEISLYKTGATFKVLGYYEHESKIPLFSKIFAYLIRLNEGKKAWILASKFDFKRCEPASMEVDFKINGEKIDKNYKKVRIKSKKLKGEFSSSDNTYEISKEEFLKFQRLIDPDYGKVLSKKEQERKRLKEAFERKDYMYVENVFARHLDFFNDRVLAILKNVKKGDMNYIRMKGIYYRVKYLQKHPNAKITHFSISAGKNSNEDVVKIVAQNDGSWSDLMRAIKSKNREKIDLLLTKNPDLNHLTNNGSNVLFFAIDSRDFITYTTLLEMGMDINSKNNFGLTPLHIAIISNAYEIAKDLLSKGAKADVLSKDDNPSTPFMIEARKTDANYEILNELLVHGANINRKYPGGNTLLIEAARICNLETVSYLLKLGVDKNEKNSFGQDYRVFEKKCPTLPHF